MSVQYAGSQFMSKRLIEVIQELRAYLGPEAQQGGRLLDAKRLSFGGRRVGRLL